MADAAHTSTDVNVHPAEVLDANRRFLLVGGFPIVVNFRFLRAAVSARP